MTSELVSVILPTFNRYEVATENIENILKQKYSNIQIIVCDDSDKNYYLNNSEKFKNNITQDKRVIYQYCARFDINGNKDYGLARARNFGVVLSEGKFLIFLDDRMTPADENTIDIFVNKLRTTKEKVWYFGDKGAQKESFVENFSAIKKCHIVDAGYFFERIDKYGGMTRELYTRFVHQGFKLQYLPEAKAKQLCKSQGWDKKPEQIIEMRSMLEKLWNHRK